jgi:hypothetical protein
MKARSYVHIFVASRRRVRRRSEGSGPPRTPMAAPATPATRSVSTTPRQRRRAAPRRQPGSRPAQGSSRAKASGIAEPRIAPIAEGPAPSRKARAERLTRSRSKRSAPRPRERRLSSPEVKGSWSWGASRGSTCRVTAGKCSRRLHRCGRCGRCDRPARSERVYAVGSDGAAFVSDDDGRTWSQR